MRGRGWLGCWLVSWLGAGLLAAETVWAVPSAATLPELPSLAHTAALESPALASSVQAPPDIVLARPIGAGGVLVQIGLQIGLFSDFDLENGPPRLRDLFTAILAAHPLRGRGAPPPFSGPGMPADGGAPPVPEPSSALLLLLGLAGLTRAGRRRV